MLGSHQEWAFRIPGSALPAKVRAGKWKVYAVVRVEKDHAGAPGAQAFSAGVYDNKARSSLAEIKPCLSEAAPDFQSYLLGELELNPDRDIWVAPAGNKSIKAIYVDRIFLVPARASPSK